MKVKIGNYVNFFGPYQLAEKILFWKDRDSDEVFRLGEIFSYGFQKKQENNKLFDDERNPTWLYRFLEWMNSKRQRSIKVKIDGWDSWSADSTIAIVVLPLLKSFREKMNGIPVVDITDLPDAFRFTVHEEWDQQIPLDFGENTEYQASSWSMKVSQWEWIVDEMIWTFEQLQPDSDWEEQYYSGNIDMRHIPVYDDNNEITCYEIVDGPTHTSSIDHDGFRKHRDRIQNGLRLFGKYYQSLWW